MWETVNTPLPCQCSDGSPFKFFIHRADPAKVVFFLQGGGACFSKETCGTKPSFTRNLQGRAEFESTRTGIFDVENPNNPFAGWSIVLVPYCTGDVHLGNAVHDYGDGVVIHHVGAVNATTALTATAAAFPKATKVAVVGASAGSAATPMAAGLAADLFPKSEILAVADASGAYPGTPAVTKAIGTLWGIDSVRPNWPEAAPHDSDGWTLPGLFVQSTRHAPRIRWARINNAYDSVQADFLKLANLAGGDEKDLINQNLKVARDGGVEVHDFLAGGTNHTIVGKAELYTATEGGTKLRDWLVSFIDGKPQPDVVCNDCTKPSPGWPSS